MTPDQTAATVIAGHRPTENDMLAYWQATDEGLCPKAETVAVLAALSAGAPDVAMMRSFVRYIRRAYPPVTLPSAHEAVNIVGTGGGHSTFNISTASAFVAAAAGGKVLKSGSSAYSSSVGSGDILNALGLARSVSDDFTGAMLAETGIAFAAPQRYAPICKRLAIAALPLNFKVIGRFVNGLGPLISPYQMRANVIGASSAALFEQIHSIARTLDITSLLVHSTLGVDEFLSIGRNRWLWSKEAQANHLDPLDMGLCPGALSDLKGGGLSENIAILTEVLKGQGNRACTETVALNAGAALYAGGVAQDLRLGTSMALDCLAQGAPFDKLEQAQAFAKSATTRSQRVA